MIAQQTIVAGSIVLRIIGLIIFGLGNDYGVRRLAHEDYDIYTVTSSKFVDQKNVSMFILFKAHNTYYDKMIIKDTFKNDIYNGPIDEIRQLKFDVINDHLREYTVYVNVTTGHITQR